MSEFDDDGWEDLRPDLGDYNLTLKESLGVSAIFFAKILGIILFVAAIAALFAYGIWREWAIFQFLSTGGA